MQMYRSFEKLAKSEIYDIKLDLHIKKTRWWLGLLWTDSGKWKKSWIGPPVLRSVKAVEINTEWQTFARIDDRFVKVNSETSMRHTVGCRRQLCSSTVEPVYNVKRKLPSILTKIKRILYI